mmetsp:Transcript_16847/g.21539  ORF Transcript_16847/g.21539 Transcript_16847/m.21539 type:complete len:81 (-) Transcript_16847:313-555(-)
MERNIAVNVFLSKFNRASFYENPLLTWHLLCFAAKNLAINLQMQILLPLVLCRWVHQSSQLQEALLMESCLRSRCADGKV